MATPHADRLHKMEAWRTSAMEDSHRHLTAVSQALVEIAAGNREVAADLGLEGATGQAARASFDRLARRMIKASDRLKQIVKASTEALTAGIDARNESIEIQTKLKTVNENLEQLGRTNAIAQGVPSAGVTAAEIEAQREAAHAEIDALAKKSLSKLNGRILAAIDTPPARRPHRPDNRPRRLQGHAPRKRESRRRACSGAKHRAGALGDRLGRLRRHLPRRTRAPRPGRRTRARGRRQRPNERRRPRGRSDRRGRVVAGHALRPAGLRRDRPVKPVRRRRRAFARGVQPARLSRSRRRRRRCRRVQGLPSSPSGADARLSSVCRARSGSGPNPLGPLGRHRARSHHRRPRTNNDNRLDSRWAFVRQCAGRGHRNRPTRPSTSLRPLVGHPARHHDRRAHADRLLDSLGALLGHLAGHNHRRAQTHNRSGFSRAARRTHPRTRNGLWFGGAHPHRRTHTNHQLIPKHRLLPKDRHILAPSRFIARGRGRSQRLNRRQALPARHGPSWGPRRIGLAGPAQPDRKTRQRQEGTPPSQRRADPIDCALRRRQNRHLPPRGTHRQHQPSTPIKHDRHTQ